MQHHMHNALLPEGYLARGYLDQNGNIYPELITDHAEHVARKLRGMTQSQFRRYFNHARWIEERVRKGTDFNSLRYELDRMKPIAMAGLVDRNAKVTRAFAEMVHRMVDAVKTGDDFVKGFMPHFEAVLAYFIYYNNEKGRRGGHRR